MIDRILDSRSYADIVLDETLKQSRLRPRDRALATEIVYGTLRWLKWLDWILSSTYSGEWAKLPRVVHRILEVGLYQLLFLDKVPDYAAVNEMVKIAVSVTDAAYGRLVNYILRETRRGSHLYKPPALDKDPVKSVAVRWSHPEWLVRRWIERFGVERTEALCRADNERPAIGIRVNVLKGTTEETTEAFSRKGRIIRSSCALPEFFFTERAGPVSSYNGFIEGKFTVQDESAGIVGYLICPEPGETIVDLTAAPGGKSTHMAELGEDKVRIMAVDRNAQRLKKVVENRDRLGLNAVLPVQADGRSMGTHAVDKVLVDAPCSGMGIIRKRGELRWLRKENEIPGLVSLQKQLLESGASLLKPGGILVYSTCTVLEDENEEIVFDFLRGHPEFEVENADRYVDQRFVTENGFVQTWPDIHGMDGSFAARMKKMR